jgi:hypothetical protein
VNLKPFKIVVASIESRLHHHAEGRKYTRFNPNVVKTKKGMLYEPLPEIRQKIIIQEKMLSKKVKKVCHKK